MRRITILQTSGAREVWEAEAIRCGNESRNAVLYKARLKEIIPLGGQTMYPDSKTMEHVILPLSPNILAVTEEDW